MNFFIPICNDLQPLVFSFLLYTESISLQLTSSFSSKKKELMDKYCQHIQPHGKIEEYDKKTKLQIYEYNYKEGKREGIQKKWYYNGQLMYKHYFKNGKPEGIQKFWHNDISDITQINKKLYYKYNYKNGKQEGIQKLWDFNGKLILMVN